MSKLAAIIMAGGKGTRMKSDIAKVLHTLNGKPLLAYVLDVADALGADPTVAIVGHQAETVKQAFADRDAVFVVQQPQLGTGHAVMQAEQALKDFDGNVLVLSGDTVLTRPETLRALIDKQAAEGAACAVLTAIYDDPGHYGRIVRNDDGTVQAIVEYRDADEATRAIRECNSGTYAFDCRKLFEALEEVGNDNDQNEYYLTDVIGILRSRGETVAAMPVADTMETEGINTVEQLQAIEDYLNEAG